MPTQSLLAVFAHPDDESFGTGGMLSRYAAEGKRVDLICATRGEAGEIYDGTTATPDELGDVREAELRCAAQTMGIRPPLFLGYRDSGMAGTAENADPRSLHSADRCEAAGKVALLIRRLKPDVVVTFEPNGGYGHPDHIAIHHITVAAVAAAADPAQYPEQLVDGLRPHKVKKFYWTALPKRFFRQMGEALVAAGVDISQMEGVRDGSMLEWGMPDELVTTTLDVSAVLERKIASFLCHRTQLNPSGPFSKLADMAGDVWRQSMGFEYFIRVDPPIAPGEPEETDLFAGI